MWNDKEACKEMLDIHIHQGNANPNNPEIPPHTSQMTADAGEDAEKEEHFSTVGGVVNWYNHSGNQSGDSSENWT